jgi:hypothetical protein
MDTRGVAHYEQRPAGVTTRDLRRDADVLPRSGPKLAPRTAAVYVERGIDGLDR